MYIGFRNCQSELRDQNLRQDIYKGYLSTQADELLKEYRWNTYLNYRSLLILKKVLRLKTVLEYSVESPNTG